MPLREGTTDEVISANIAELIRSGYSKEQAAAIAYQKAGRAKKRSGELHKALGVYCGMNGEVMSKANTDRDGVTPRRATHALRYRMEIIASQIGPLAIRAQSDVAARRELDDLLTERYAIMTALGEAEI